jgi:flagellar protein FlaI
MVNQELVNYFTYYLKQGHEPEALKERSLESGWQKKDIEQALEEAIKISGYQPKEKPKEEKVEKVKKAEKKTGKKEEKKEPEIKKIIKPKLKRPWSKIVEPTKPVKRGKVIVLESYEIEVDKAKVRVVITKESSTTVYNLQIPEIGVATVSFLDEIRNQLISATTISMKEITDPGSFGSIKKRFMQEASALIDKKMPGVEKHMKEFLIGKLMQDMLGLGEIEFLVNDINLEEVVIPSAKEPIRVYHKEYGWLPTNLKISREEEIVNYSNIVARRVGRQITVLSPLLDAHLVTGDRVNSILYPVSTKGNTITIRKFARDPYTIIDLINNGTCNPNIAALLWLAVEFEMNIIISGGTASGKTVVLNACMPFIPPNHRIISVEDTRELMLPDFLYWSPLVTRLPNPEGKGEVNMLHLLVNSLRMRPDRIILGEMRRKEEAMVLFEAMHTGHSVYATLHADSAAETVNRLTNPPLSVPPNLLKAVNLNVVMFRDRKKGIRRILQIAEFESGKDRAEANLIYRWIPEEDKIIEHSESSRFFEDVSRNTGMSSSEINRNLKEKQTVLNWLVKHKIRNLNSFGKVLNLYYTNKEFLLDTIKKNNTKVILED